ncbi:MAG TPA: DUF397 domain-containing protein, partial [Streptosporangiaceae bacterium]|jgi:hypothetical protein|nr:DUF397 domain-containing protein [Streptosporangiaceae bacterium]
MKDRDLSRTVWFKSSYSNGQGGNCVETLRLPDGSRAVRHSKDADGSVLIFTTSEWDAFIKGVKDGEFD